MFNATCRALSHDTERYLKTKLQIYNEPRH